MAGLRDVLAEGSEAAVLGTALPAVRCDPAKADDRRIVDNFRTKCLGELMKIKTAWPGLKYRIERGRRGEKSGALVLLPSKPSIPRLKLVE